MNYVFRLGLVHFMRRDPSGIRRDPRRARGENLLFPLTSCHEICFSLGLGAFHATGSERDPTGSAQGEGEKSAISFDFLS